MSALNLLNCPFCGGEAKIVHEGFSNSPVVCAANGCGQALTVAVWNTRATSEADALRAEIERLREALSAMLDLQDNASPFGGEMYRDRVDRVFDQCRAAMKGGDA